MGDDMALFLLPLRKLHLGRGPDHILGLVLALVTDGAEEYTSCCSSCSGKMLLRRIGSFAMDIGDPVRFLTMIKPEDWATWGTEEDRLWWPRDTPVLEFAII